MKISLNTVMIRRPDAASSSLRVDAALVTFGNPGAVMGRMLLTSSPLPTVPLFEDESDYVDKEPGPATHTLLVETMEHAASFWDGSTLDGREGYGLKQAMTGVELEKWFDDLDADAQARALGTLRGQFVTWLE